MDIIPKATLCRLRFNANGPSLWPYFSTDIIATLVDVSAERPYRVCHVADGLIVGKIILRRILTIYYQCCTMWSLVTNG